MLKWIETTGRSEEDAIAAALFQLGMDRDDVSVEVIERAKSGFLGFGGNPAKVRVSYEVPGEDEEPSSPAPASRKGNRTITSRVSAGTATRGSRQRVASSAPDRSSGSVRPSRIA